MACLRLLKCCFIPDGKTITLEIDCGGIHDDLLKRYLCYVLLQTFICFRWSLDYWSLCRPSTLGAEYSRATSAYFPAQLFLYAYGWGEVSEFYVGVRTILVVWTKFRNANQWPRNFEASNRHLDDWFILVRDIFLTQFCQLQPSVCACFPRVPV